METAGINYVKERHGERSLMARNSIERLGGEYDLESRASAFSCTPGQESTQLSQASTNVVLLWF